MAITEYVATTARAFMAAEIAMALCQLRRCECHPRASRETAWRLLCLRRTGDPLDRE